MNQTGFFPDVQPQEGSSVFTKHTLIKNLFLVGWRAVRVPRTVLTSPVHQVTNMTYENTGVMLCLPRRHAIVARNEIEHEGPSRASLYWFPLSRLLVQIRDHAVRMA